jgi:hypothetical protein
MTKNRRGSFSLKEDRQLIQMAAASAILEEAAAALRTSVKTIERTAKRLGLTLKGRDGRKRLSARHADDQGLKAKGKWPRTRCPEMEDAMTKEKKTAEELAAMILQDLSNMDGCPSPITGENESSRGTNERVIALSECGELRSVWLSYRRQNRYPD